jgi:hypothetical protein
LVVNFFMALFVAREKKWDRMFLGVLLFPVYWLLHCLASYDAVYQLIRKPHHWNKTEHGVSKFVP